MGDVPPLTTEELRANASNWSLAGDVGLLAHLNEFSMMLVKRVEETEGALNKLFDRVDEVSTKFNNISNQFSSLQNSQFMENRVYEEDSPTEEAPIRAPTEQESQQQTFARYKEAVATGLVLLDSHFEQIDVPESSDSEDDSPGGVRPLLLRPKPVYCKPLPLLIGSAEWWADDSVGLSEYEENQHSEPELTSDSEPVSHPEVEKRLRRSPSTSSSHSTEPPSEPKRPYEPPSHLAPPLIPYPPPINRSEEKSARTGDGRIFNSEDLFGDYRVDHSRSHGLFGSSDSLSNRPIGRDLFSPPENDLFDDIPSASKRLGVPAERSASPKGSAPVLPKDDENDGDSLFGSDSTAQPKPVNKKVSNDFTKELAAKLGNVARKQSIRNVENEDVPPAKPQLKNIGNISSKQESITSEKPLSPASQNVTKDPAEAGVSNSKDHSLFEEATDLFRDDPKKSSSPKPKPTTAKPATSNPTPVDLELPKPKPPAFGLFGDDDDSEDDLFGGANKSRLFGSGSKRTASDLFDDNLFTSNKSLEKEKVGTVSSYHNVFGGDLFADDDDGDLFAPTFSSKPKVTFSEESNVNRNPTIMKASTPAARSSSMLPSTTDDLFGGISGVDDSEADNSQLSYTSATIPADSQVEENEADVAIVEPSHDLGFAEPSHLSGNASHNQVTAGRNSPANWFQPQLSSTRSAATYNDTSGYKTGALSSASVSGSRSADKPVTEKSQKVNASKPPAELKDNDDLFSSESIPKVSPRISNISNVNAGRESSGPARKLAGENVTSLDNDDLFSTKSILVKESRVRSVYEDEPYSAVHDGSKLPQPLPFDGEHSISNPLDDPDDLFKTDMKSDVKNSVPASSQKSSAIKDSIKSDDLPASSTSVSNKSSLREDLFSSSRLTSALVFDDNDDNLFSGGKVGTLDNVSVSSDRSSLFEDQTPGKSTLPGIFEKKNDGNSALKGSLFDALDDDFDLFAPKPKLDKPENQSKISTQKINTSIREEKASEITFDYTGNSKSSPKLTLLGNTSTNKIDDFDLFSAESKPVNPLSSVPASSQVNTSHQETKSVENAVLVGKKHANSGLFSSSPESDSLFGNAGDLDVSRTTASGSVITGSKDSSAAAPILKQHTSSGLFSSSPESDSLFGNVTAGNLDANRTTAVAPVLTANQESSAAAPVLKQHPSSGLFSSSPESDNLFGNVTAGNLDANRTTAVAPVLTANQERSAAAPVLKQHPSSGLFSSSPERDNLFGNVTAGNLDANRTTAVAPVLTANQESSAAAPVLKQHPSSGLFSSSPESDSLFGNVTAGNLDANRTTAVAPVLTANQERSAAAPVLKQHPSSGLFSSSPESDNLFGNVTAGNLDANRTTAAAPVLTASKEKSAAAPVLKQHPSSDLFPSSPESDNLFGNETTSGLDANRTDATVPVLTASKERSAAASDLRQHPTSVLFSSSPESDNLFGDVTTSTLAEPSSSNDVVSARTTSPHIKEMHSEKSVLVDNKNLDSIKAEAASDVNRSKPMPPSSLPVTKLTDLFSKDVIDGEIVKPAPKKTIGKLNIPFGLNINTAALLPGAKKPKPSTDAVEESAGAESPSTTENSSRLLQSSFGSNINTAALLPGAKKPQSVGDSVVGASAVPQVATEDGSGLLQSSLRDRARPVKRRPQSRKARQEALRTSGIDFDVPNQIGTSPSSSGIPTRNDPPPGISEFQTTPSLTSPGLSVDSTSTLFYSAENTPSSAIASPSVSNPMSPSTDEEDYFNVLALDSIGEQQSLFKRDTPSGGEGLNSEMLFGQPPVLSPTQPIEKKATEAPPLFVRNPAPAPLDSVQAFDTVPSLKVENPVKSTASSLFDDEPPKIDPVKHSSVFDDDDEDDDLFTSAMASRVSVLGSSSKSLPGKSSLPTPARRHAAPSKVKSLFGDSDEDDDDIFSGKLVVAPTKASVVTTLNSSEGFVSNNGPPPIVPSEAKHDASSFSDPLGLFK